MDSKTIKAFDAMISEYKKDIQKIYEMSGLDNQQLLLDDGIKDSVSDIKISIMTIELAKMNIVSFKGISKIVKDIENKINVLISDLDKPDVSSNNTKKRFIENGIRRLEEYIGVFKVFQIKR